VLIGCSICLLWFTQDTRSQRDYKANNTPAGSKINVFV